MPAPFPLIKLGSLLIKQISKPIANFVKERAKSHPFFRTYVCMPPAQFYNWCEIKLKMWVLNLGKPVNIPVLSEQMAIELGANLLGEGIVFLAAVGALTAEYTRSSRKEAAKELARKEVIRNLEYQLNELYIKVETHEKDAVKKADITKLINQLQDQNAQLQDMYKIVVELSGSSGLPGKPRTPPPSGPVLIPITKESNFDSSIRTLEYDIDKGIILEAVRTMESEIFRRDNDDRIRENGIITDAILYIENDFFKRPVPV